MTQSPTTVRLERTYAAPAQAVFDAWTSPEVMRRWWHAGGPDWQNVEAVADPRVGGRLHVTMRSPDGTEYGGGGEYTEVDPPRRLAFTWTWDGEDASSSIELEFAEQGRETTVVLTHSGLRGEESAESHREGWEHTLENLGRALAS